MAVTITLFRIPSCDSINIFSFPCYKTSQIRIVQHEGQVELITFTYRIGCTGISYHCSFQRCVDRCQSSNISHSVYIRCSSGNSCCKCAVCRAIIVCHSQENVCIALQLKICLILILVSSCGSSSSADFADGCCKVSIRRGIINASMCSNLCICCVINICGHMSIQIGHLRNNLVKGTGAFYTSIVHIAEYEPTDIAICCYSNGCNKFTTSIGVSIGCVRVNETTAHANVQTLCQVNFIAFTNLHFNAICNLAVSITLFNASVKSYSIKGICG